MGEVYLLLMGHKEPNWIKSPAIHFGGKGRKNPIMQNSIQNSIQTHITESKRGKTSYTGKKRGQARIRQTAINFERVRERKRVIGGGRRGGKRVRQQNSKRVRDILRE